MIGSLRCKDGEGKGKRRVKSDLRVFNLHQDYSNSPCLLWQMNASCPSEKERTFCRCLFTSPIKHEIRHFHVPSRGRGKEMYEKAKCACKVVVLLIVYCVFKVLVAVAGNVLCSSHELLKATPLSASHNKVLNQPNN